MENNNDLIIYSSPTGDTSSHGWCRNYKKIKSDWSHPKIINSDWSHLKKMGTKYQIRLEPPQVTI